MNSSIGGDERRKGDEITKKKHIFERKWRKKMRIKSVN